MQLNNTLNPKSKSYQGILQPLGFPSLPQNWSSEWETFPSSDGSLQLFAINHHLAQWTEPRALVILHGLGEHGGRYLHFPHYVQDVVQSVYCLDHRGHGRSEGLRGHIDRFDLYIEDAVYAIKRYDDQLKKRFGRSEIHLLGHSMGGLIAIRALLKNIDLPILSASISAPLLGIEVELPLLKRAAAQVMARVWGKIHMNSEVDAALLSHDSEVQQVYREDRLVHSKGTPRFYVELVAAMSDTLEQKSSLGYPVEFMFPSEDHIVDGKLGLQFAQKIEAKEKQILTYQGFYHEIFNELGKDRVFEDLKKWIVKHTQLK